MPITNTVAASLAPGRVVLSNRELRRLQLALLATETCTPAWAIALGVYAFAHGGAAAVGLLGLVALLPAAVAAPFAAHLADRHRRERVMAVAAASRGLLIALTTACLAFDAPAAVILTLVALSSIFARVFFPAQAALLPSLARSETELRAANTIGSMIENVGSIVGPALAGLVLALHGPELVGALVAAATLGAAAQVSRVRAPGPPAPDEAGEAAHGGLLAGFRAVAGTGELRLLVGLFTAQTFVFGLLSVLTIVVAFDLMRLGAAGVGLLEVALGVGGIVAGFAAVAAIGKGLGSQLRIGLVLWGLPLALVGIWPEAAAAAVLFGLIGFGNTLFDVAVYTLLQEHSPAGVRARVFGVLEALAVGAVALGSICAPLLLALAGPRVTLLLSGSLLVGLALVTSRRLDRFDRREAAEPELATATA